MNRPETHISSKFINTVVAGIESGILSRGILSATPQPDLNYSDCGMCSRVAGHNSENRVDCVRTCHQTTRQLAVRRAAFRDLLSWLNAATGQICLPATYTSHACSQVTPSRGQIHTDTTLFTINKHVAVFQSIAVVLSDGQ